MDTQQKDFYRFTCLLDEKREQLTKKILNDPHDVSHDWYVELFKDFDWRAYEEAKTTSCE